MCFNENLSFNKGNNFLFSLAYPAYVPTYKWLFDNFLPCLYPSRQVKEDIASSEQHPIGTWLVDVHGKEYVCRHCLPENLIPALSTLSTRRTPNFLPPHPLLLQPSTPSSHPVTHCSLSLHLSCRLASLDPPSRHHEQTVEGRYYVDAGGQYLHQKKA